MTFFILFGNYNLLLLKNSYEFVSKKHGLLAKGIIMFDGELQLEV
jgi:hypothetical protein